MKKMLKSFKNMKKNIKNNICHSEIMMFDKCDKDNNSIKSVYKNFQNIKF